MTHHEDFQLPEFFHYHSVKLLSIVSGINFQNLMKKVTVGLVFSKIDTVAKSET